MKQISNLTAGATTEIAALPPANGSHVTQSQNGFWRRAEILKTGVLLKSSAGGMVSIPWAEIWAVGEKADANLITPKTS